MTKTRYRQKPVWHETAAAYGAAGKSRAICVAESATALLVKLKGTRTVLSLPYTTAYERAAALAADLSVCVVPRRRNVKRGQL